jgi:hypothetical protein
LELQIALGLQRRGKLVKVEATKLLVQEIKGDPAFHINQKIVGIAGSHLGLRGLLHTAVNEGQSLAAQLVEKQARADESVIRLRLDQWPSCHDDGLRQFAQGNAVIEIAVGFRQHEVRRHTVEPEACFMRVSRKMVLIQRAERSVCVTDTQGRGGGGIFINASRFRVLFTVEHISTGNLVMLASHQCQFDLVLDIFDMESPAGIGATRQLRNDRRYGSLNWID